MGSQMSLVISGSHFPVDFLLLELSSPPYYRPGKPELRVTAVTILTGSDSFVGLLAFPEGPAVTFQRGIRETSGLNTHDWNSHPDTYK